MRREVVLGLVLRNVVAMAAAGTMACGGDCEDVAETFASEEPIAKEIASADAGAASEDSGAEVDGEGAAPIDAACAAACGPSLKAGHRLAACEEDTATGLARCTTIHRECSAGYNAPSHCGMGRPPEGYVAAPLNGEELGHVFARMAELEAASITAFRYLERDLLRLGAPRDLVERARAARRDEAAHTRMMGALAHRHGVEPRRARHVAYSLRPLEGVARENVVEGCVNETYAALVATWASSRATDDDVRSVMTIIARDETRHAALAWDIADWADSLLTDDARERNARARDRTIADLAVEARREVPLAHRAAGVVPSRDEATALVDQLAKALWSQAG